MCLAVAASIYFDIPVSVSLPLVNIILLNVCNQGPTHYTNYTNRENEANC